MSQSSADRSVLAVITPIKDPDYTCLRQCVLSVEAQSKENNILIEHLFIVSGLFDAQIQRSILAKSTSSYSPRFYFDIDSGLYDAMNKGIHLVSADFYLFLNHDDFLTSNFSSMINHANAKASFDLYCSNSYLHVDENKIVPFSSPLKSLLSSFLLKLNFFPYMPFNHGAMLFRRKVFIFYEYTLSTLHDDFSLFLSIVNDRKLKTDFLPQLYTHFFRFGGLMTSINPFHKFKLDHHVLYMAYKHNFFKYLFAVLALFVMTAPQIVKYSMNRK